MKCKLCGRNVKLFENTKYGMCDACCETDEGKAQLQAIADRIKDEKNSRNKAGGGTSNVTTGYSDFAIIVGWLVGGAGLLGGVINIGVSTASMNKMASSVSATMPRPISRDIPNCWQKLLFQGQLQYGLCPH